MGLAASSFEGHYAELGPSVARVHGTREIAWTTPMETGSSSLGTVNREGAKDGEGDERRRRESNPLPRFCRPPPGPP